MFHVEQSVFHDRFGAICKSNGAICKSIALFFLVNLWDNIQVAGGTSHNPPRAGLFNNLLQKENDMSDHDSDTLQWFAGACYSGLGFVWAWAETPEEALRKLVRRDVIHDYRDDHRLSLCLFNPVGFDGGHMDQFSWPYLHWAPRGKEETVKIAPVYSVSVDVPKLPPMKRGGYSGLHWRTKRKFEAELEQAVQEGWDNRQEWEIEEVA